MVFNQTNTKAVNIRLPGKMLYFTFFGFSAHIADEDELNMMSTLLMVRITQIKVESFNFERLDSEDATTYISD